MRIFAIVTGGSAKPPPPANLRASLRDAMLLVTPGRNAARHGTQCCSSLRDAMLFVTPGRNAPDTMLLVPPGRNSSLELRISI